MALLVAADQVTKLYFHALLVPGEQLAVTNWFNFVHIYNPGAAFSLLADAAGWQRPLLIAVGLVVSLGLGFACLTNRVAVREQWLAAGAIAGGLGNTLDRLRIGAVEDFLDFHWQGFHWPAFNLADMLLVSSLLAWWMLSLHATLRIASSTSGDAA